MALAPCRDCGKPISTQAEQCPACGARFPTASGRRIVKGVLVGVGVLVVLTVALVGALIVASR